MKWLYKAAALFFRLIYRVEIAGKEHIPEKGPYIICPNHHHAIDPPLIAIIFKQKTYFMAKEELFKNKAFAWFITALGSFPVNRSDGGKTAIVAAVSLLEKNKPICLFPQGKRVPIGQETTIKSGALHIAQQANCVIIPVYIETNYRLFSRLTIHIASPIHVEKEENLEEKKIKLKEVIHGRGL